VTTSGAVKYEGRRRLSVAHLLIAIVVLFVVAPFVDRVAYGHLIESLVFTVVLVAGVNAVGGRRRTLLVAAVLAAPVILIRWLNHLWPELLPADLGLVTALLFVSYVLVHLLRFVIAAPVVNAEVLCAAISIYLLYAVAWGFVYTLLYRWDPSWFVFTEPTDADATLTGFTALYFSVQILTTVTFGDILPVSNIARMMALVEATVGIFYLAILISRLVGLYSSDRT
jgi:hypothetical protein